MRRLILVNDYNIGKIKRWFNNTNHAHLAINKNKFRYQVAF